MKKASLLLVLLTLGTFVMYSQVKIVLEKDVKTTKESVTVNDSVVNAEVAKNDNMKTAEELEAIINELSFRDREKIIERNKRKNETRKSRKT